MNRIARGNCAKYHDCFTANCYEKHDCYSRFGNLIRVHRVTIEREGVAGKAGQLTPYKEAGE
jgi:hypothetical protein